jgi:hypothetical protein
MKEDEVQWRDGTLAHGPSKYHGHGHSDIVFVDLELDESKSGIEGTEVRKVLIFFPFFV